MNEQYKQNESYDSIAKQRGEQAQAPTQNKYSLPYGLCAKYGIYLDKGATPTDAWNALKGIGIKPSDAYKSLQENGEVDVHPTGKKVIESKEKTKNELKNWDSPIDPKNLSKEEKASLVKKYNDDKYGTDLFNQSEYSVNVLAEVFDPNYGDNEDFTNFVNSELGISTAQSETDVVGGSATNDVVKDKDKKESTTKFSEDAYTEERYNNALNSEDPKVYDNMARTKTFETWKQLSQEEKFATVDYTGGYCKYNEPLRGIEYGTSKFLGEGNVDMDSIGMSYGGFKKGEIKKRIDALTSAIDKSSYDKDVILRRGTNYAGMDNFFKGVDLNTLKYGSQADLENALVGNVYTDGAFMSCGSTKGKGFSGNIKFSIYAPKGTKMMYVEPVSDYGAQYGINWNGEPQKTFNSENETVIQRGTSFRVTQVKRTFGGNMYVRMEVVAQKTFS